MKTLNSVLCVFGLFLAGCATNEQFVRLPDQSKAVEDPTKGRIYVIRPSSGAAASSFEVWDGNVHIGSTASRSYLCWERKPGEVSISGKEENVSTVKFEVSSNQIYYILQEPKWGWVQARNKLQIIQEEQAARELKKCKAPKQATCRNHSECISQSKNPDL